MSKKTAPTLVLVIIICFILLQAAGIILAFTAEGLHFFWKALVTVIPLVVIIALISVYMERLREIDEEEKEDMRQY